MLMESREYLLASSFCSTDCAVEVLPVPTTPTSSTGWDSASSREVRYSYRTLSTVGTISLKNGNLFTGKTTNLVSKWQSSVKILLLVRLEMYFDFNTIKHDEQFGHSPYGSDLAPSSLKSHCAPEIVPWWSVSSIKKKTLSATVH